MPHHKSCRKRVVTSKKQNVRNRANRSSMKTIIKKVLGATTQAQGQEQLASAYAAIDKSAKTGLIHKNNAANKKSRLARFVSKLAA